MSHFSGYGRRVEGGNYKEDVVSIFKIYVARGAGMEGVGKAVRDKQQDLVLMTSRLRFLPAHDSLFLLRGCLAIPRLLYILRTSPCYDSEELALYDECLKTALTSLLNVGLDGSRWIQASLPVWAGGLGVRGCEALAPSAFLASLHGSATLVAQLLPNPGGGEPDPLLPGALAAWGRAGGPTHPDPPPQASVARQAAWDRPVCEGISAGLLATCGSPADSA